MSKVNVYFPAAEGGLLGILTLEATSEKKSIHKNKLNMIFIQVHQTLSFSPLLLSDTAPLGLS